jgi:dimethylaniline monooxygenase (N-oxide forming)
LHVKPNIPDIPGIEHLRGEAYHSAQYKSRDQLKDRNLLIIGCGETAMDIAYEAIKANAKSVTMCFRTGFLSFPKVLNRFQVFGKTFGGSLPIDGLITNLFETAYVHHAVARSRMRWFVSDSVIKRVMWFLTGTQGGCNQHIGQLPNDRLGRAYVFLNKSHKAMPYLNRPYKKPDPILRLIGNEYIDPPEDAQSVRWVDTCTCPSSIDKEGRVIFNPNPERRDYRRLKDAVVIPDTLIYCTGYTQSFEWLQPSYPTPSTASCRNIVDPSQPTISFIGFVRPGVGAIPPIAEQQAMWWTAYLLGKMPRLPSSEPHYHLLAPTNARIQYGVDHSAYMSTLAKDMRASPGLLALWSEYGWEVMLVYCFGAAFTSFYRLTGPFKDPAMKGIVQGELKETVMRRGLVGNFFFGLVPMVSVTPFFRWKALFLTIETRQAFYGSINLTAYLLELIGLLAHRV